MATLPSAPSYKTEPDPARQARAREYTRISRRIALAGLVLNLAVLLVLLVGGVSTGLRDLLSMPQPARVALYAIILVLGYFVVTLPVSVYRGHVLPRRFGISTQSLSAWFADAAKGLLVELALGVAAISAVYWLLEHAGSMWWIWASVLAVIFTVVLANLAPVLIMPLFYKQKPLEDEALKQRLVSLAERARVHVKGVFVIDMSSKGTAANAGLMGLGNTRRIVLGDTLMGVYTPEEIETVLAHEMGHHANRDIPTGIALQTAATVAGLYLASLALNWAVPALGYQSTSDIAALPILVAVVAGFGMATGPLLSAYSRWREKNADLYSLRLTGNPEAFISAMTRLTDQNLGEARPARWAELLFYDHPPYYRRVAVAKAFRAGMA